MAPTTVPPRSKQRRPCLAIGLVLLAGLTGCDKSTETARPGAGSSVQTQHTRPSVLRLATTTSTADTGLLDHLLPEFETAHNARVDVIAVGTGQAMKLGERGEVDVLLVHAKASELKFLEAGHAIRRDDVMFNTFLLLGPKADPASIRGRDIVTAMKAIHRIGAKFVSRGDDSGTHKRELSFWESGGGLKTWDGYVETGRGQGQSLMIASEMDAHALCDRGTYLKLRDKISLVPLVETDPQLHNPYGVLVINPRKHHRINKQLATKLAEYLISGPVRQKIAQFRVEGEPLFFPHMRDTP